MVSIVQNAPTNFETDLFLPIINAVADLSGRVNYGDSKTTDISFKVIADHIRALSFAIGDGALPSNEGRGYVLRRLLRRAVMHGKKLGIDTAFLYKLVPIVGEIMESYYPEVLEQQEFIEKVIRNEEERFHETINEGLDILNQVIAQVKADGQDTLAGQDIFKLYDTYGFPVELTEEVAEDEGLKVDHQGFEQEMDAQRARARAARQTELSMGVQSALLTDIKVDSRFVGYDSLEANSELLVIIQDEALHDSVSTGEANLFLPKHHFTQKWVDKLRIRHDRSRRWYDCSGSDGCQKSTERSVLAYCYNQSATKRRCGLFLTSGYQHRRNKIIKNHTATHLLHKA